jgi:NAD(P)H-hydrate epimerase
MVRKKEHPLKPSLALYSAEQIKQIEQRYSDSLNGTYPLMERAGASVFHHLLQKWPETKHILVVTGKGNNAGDGFIVARLATERRLKVTLCYLEKPSELTGDALRAYQKISHRSVKTVDYDRVDYANYDLVVDAMLGTGIKGKLREPYLSFIQKVNASPIPVLSVDLPTGLEADTGFVHSDAIHANMTVTMVGQKKGIYTGDSANYRGAVELSELDIPSALFEQGHCRLYSQNWDSIKRKLKPREGASHKGLFGHSVIIGGQNGMGGASLLAATAAARSGCGLTSALVGEQAAQSLNQFTPEVMASGLSEESFSRQLSALKSSRLAFVIGPGLGQTDWSRSVIAEVSNNENVRMNLQVWDADALNFLAKFDDKDKRDNQRIITPHPGEAARLLNTDTLTISKDRYGAAQQLAKIYGGICVLKGSGTIISDEMGVQAVCPVGNPGMSSGGMGDVLAGLIGGLLAQGFEPMDAATIGVCVHGEAADRAAGPKRHYRGMLASDLFDYFPPLLNP